MRVRGKSTGSPRVFVAVQSWQISFYHFRIFVCVVWLTHELESRVGKDEGFWSELDVLLFIYFCNSIIPCVRQKLYYVDWTSSHVYNFFAAIFCLILSLFLYSHSLLLHVMLISCESLEEVLTLIERKHLLRITYRHTQRNSAQL